MDSNRFLNRVWCLDRTYGGPQIWFRVTNNEQGAQLMLDETAEVYDFNITWNTHEPGRGEGSSEVGYSWVN